MLLWIDIETTGLFFDKDIPMEIGMILMQEEGLQEIARSSWLCAVRDYDFVPENDFVFDMHTKNGLLKALDQAATWTSWSSLDDSLVYWVDSNLRRNNIDVDQLLHPAGSSVHFDIRFIERRFPGLHSRLHHRHLDVSSIKMLSTLAGREYDKGPDDPHRALGDLENDIAWLRYFMEELSMADPIWIPHADA